MSIEILDKGACKAAGTVDTGAPITLARTQGIVSVAAGVPGSITLVLSEGIGQEEFLAFVTSEGEGLGIIGQASWIDPFTVEITTRAAATGDLAEGIVYFMFFRLEQGLPTIIPPLP